MNSTLLVVPPNSPHSRESTLPPYESSPSSPTNAVTPAIDQNAIRVALSHLANDPRLSQLGSGIQNLGSITFDVQRLPFPLVQAMVIVGLAMNREIDQNNE